jgi:peroxiredoxin
MTQLGELQGALPQFTSRRVTLVAISVDEPARNQAVVDRLHLGFPVLADGERSAIRAYGVEDVENGGEQVRPTTPHLLTH